MNERTDSTDRPTSTPLISRRRALSLAAAGAGGLVLSACGSDDGAAASGTETSPTSGQLATPDCTLTPEQIEGPFYTDLRLARRDITDGKPGSPLTLRIAVVDAATCQPISDAVVDVWHADAGGLYSAFTEQGDDQNIDTTAEKFLRGIQTTDAGGVATIDTIYPGWYAGRTTHIHLKVHLSDQTRVTTQLFFPDQVSTTVYADHDAYTERGPKDTPNADDDFGGDSSSLLMTVEGSGGGHTATHTIGIER